MNPTQMVSCVMSLKGAGSEVAYSGPTTHRLIITYLSPSTHSSAREWTTSLDPMMVVLYIYNLFGKFWLLVRMFLRFIPIAPNMYHDVI